MSEGGAVNQKRSTNLLCHTVAKGISEIVRFSLDEDFRKKSFQTLSVKSSNELENKIYQQLLVLTENSTTVTHLSSSDESEDNETQLNQPLNVGQTSATNHQSEFNDETDHLRQIYSKNWLKMSIKKKRQNLSSKRHLTKQN